MSSYTGGGPFATSRRGGLALEQIMEIQAHKSRDRPTPDQALASMYGVTVQEIREAVKWAPPEKSAPPRKSRARANPYASKHEKRSRKDTNQDIARLRVELADVVKE